MATMAAAGATAAASVPSLTRSRRTPAAALHQQAVLGGLRLPADRFALKSSFSNGGSSVLLPFPRGDQKVTMRTATKGAYICKDCGYIYSDRKPFDKLPDDFRCPVCAAPKRRFKPYEQPVAPNANQLDVRKARKEQLKNDAPLGNALPVAIVVGLAALVGIFLYLNSQY